MPQEAEEPGDSETFLAPYLAKQKMTEISVVLIEH
jgi:hypothetical protein